ncbi:helix-turn-helix transcriptional regulator [Metasolibacillus sp.]|uniref:helix-turn-helix domain-containing protein n=1 Tax=Metasolibacillus sp. TaxID=2703680 RepID=UPI0025F0D737|nr:helix-turn-helix transcriptional regulator [Metasolibacillus sp.]MCT6925858.1 helix-turn-helix transcriptional regulator [Metasolibacillus sp.]MCT6942015.1 helix-turn-helix transcriptional regulator [Metasolibacillus sp.]
MIGHKLKKLRGKRTQEEIAHAIGISRASYSHFENGHREPDNEILLKIADLYEVSVDYLLGREDNRGLYVKERNLAYNDEEVAFQAFANDPELQQFYRELYESDEEAVKKLRDIWEIIKHERKSQE